jgi:hypothetical protein
VAAALTVAAPGSAGGSITEALYRDGSSGQLAPPNNMKKTTVYLFELARQSMESVADLSQLLKRSSAKK